MSVACSLLLLHGTKQAFTPPSLRHQREEGCPCRMSPWMNDTEFKKKMMNIFRLLGDLSHLISFFFLIQRLLEKKNAVGISLKTQELFLLVFLTRYLDLFFHFYSLYNTLMKITYIAASIYIVYLIRVKYASSYEAHLDSYLHIQFAILPAVVLSLIFNEGDFWKQNIFSYGFEICWAFSLYLESIAILPQLILLQRYKSVENITSWYIFSLGAYRALYILNWIYRLYTETHYRAYIPWLTGVIQTAFYVDFFYYFALSKMHGSSAVILPS